MEIFEPHLAAAAVHGAVFYQLAALSPGHQFSLSVLGPFIDHWVTTGPARVWAKDAPQQDHSQAIQE